MRTILNWMMAACAGCNLLFLLTLMKREAPHRVVEVVTLVEYPDITAEEKTLPAVIEQRIDAEMVGERIREMQGICTEYDQDLCRRSLGYLGDFYSNFTKRTVKELPLWKTEFKIRSQNGEDGILWYLFSVLGVSNKKAIEISVQDGTECNTANLVLRGGWEVLMFDGSKENRERGLKFYKSFKDERITVPRFVAAWITIDNIEDLVREQGFEGDVDLLSIDIDGIDYWLWKRMDFVNPRVVVVEYQDILGPERAWSIPYSSNFTWKSNLGPDYGGASLMAFIKLGRQKGYRFIGCQSLGFNAFFLRRDVGAELFPEVTPEESGCFDVPKVRDGMRDRFPRVKDLDWVKV